MSRNKDDNQCAGKWGPRPSQNLDPNRKWAAVRRRYEWDDSYDDEAVAPRDEELEQELFGEENHIHTGLNFAKYDKIKVTVNGSREINPINTFEEANLHSAMKENVKLARYTVPTPVQKYSIPIITEGLDLMACAQTGSGKTAAFLIPILSKVFTAKRSTRQTASARRYKVEPLVLILAPTRELATQIFDECRRFTYRSMMRPCVVYGGAEAGPQRAELAKGCDILAATPGRLSDFIDRGVLSLRKVRYLVLDEADRMLDMGFEGDIRKIVQKSDLLDDGSRQTMMFSATFPENIQSLARDFLKNDYLFLTVGRIGGTTSDITQRIEYVEEKKKRTKLVELLLKQPPSRTLIFVETKRGADSLDDYLYHQNFPTTSIHGDRTQREREDALMSFKNGRSPILIATAVAARGLDIKNVMHVINYDLCNDIDEYVHRIGRTARVGNEGLATTFYNEKNSEIASDLVKLLTECKQEVPEFLQSYMPSNTTFDDDKIGGSSSRYRNRNDDKNDNDNWNKNDNWDKNDSWNKNDNSYNNNNNNNNNNSNNNNNNNPWDSNPTQSQQLPPPLQPQQTSIQPQLQQLSQYPQQSQYQHQPQATNDSWQNTVSIPHQQSSFPPQPPIQSFQQQSHSQQNNLQQQPPPQPQYNQSQYVSQPSYNNTQPPRVFSPQPQQPISQYGGSAPPLPPPQQQNYGYNSSPPQQQQQSQPYQQIPPPQQPQLFTNFGVSPNNGYNY